MLSKGKLSNGINSQAAPAIPRAPRSIRGKRLLNRVVKDGEICAFELLAAVAGKLLQENESSSASSSAAVGLGHRGVSKDATKKEVHDVHKFYGEHDEQGSSEESIFFSSLCSKNSNKEETNNLVREMVGQAVIEPATIACSTNSVKVDSDVESAVQVRECQLVKLPCKSEGGSPNCGESSYANQNTYSQRGNGVTGLVSGPKDADEFCRESPALGNSNEIAELMLQNSGSKPKHAHRIRKSCYEQGRSQHDTPHKKRKLFDHSSTVTYERGNSSESVSNSPEDIDITKGSWAAKLHRGTAAPSSFTVNQKSPSSTGSNVKIAIKSFKVPELLLEIPESATIGSLKKTVLDSVTHMLGGGLRVGVVLCGKKLRDDNRTLLEAGISRNGYLDTLGFLLEPTSPTQPSPPVFAKTPSPLACDSPKGSSHRSQFNFGEDLLISHTTDKRLVANSGSYDDSNEDLAPSPAPFLVKELNFDSKAVIPVPETIVEPLAVVPVSQRSSRSDIGQRRTRRPFSVTEVEALVAAVERLGTGRWRDIKLSAFENAKHRTYVDLKDKWKTLVHTARISPQQRRGEPVPQELLDRVLAAHACWTQNQTKQQNQQHGIIKITEVSSDY